MSSVVEAIYEVFSEMQVRDEEFFYAIDTYNSGRHQNVVWVHKHYKHAHREFNGFICIGTTYFLNQWCMPLASFSSVNQHKQPIFLRFSLITRDDTETYRFVLLT